MSPFCGRRRCLAFIPAAMSAAMLGGWTSSVSASPGFLGKYDFAHPMFLQGTVVGIDINADNLARALERRVIAEAHTEITADNIAQADLVVLATPVATLPSLCRLLLPHP